MSDAPNPGWFWMYGHYEAQVVISHFPIEEVKKWLPDDLELAPQDIAPDGMHPCFFLFGVETDVGIKLTPFCPSVHWFPPIIGYKEFALVIPFTQWKTVPASGYQGPFLYTGCIFVSGEVIAFGGSVLYGFPKRVARFEVNAPTSYQAFDKELYNSPYCTAEFVNETSSPDDATRAQIANILQQPSISQKSDGTYLGSGFWWNLDTASFTNSDCTAVVTEYLLPGCASGTTQVVASGTSDLSVGGSFMLVTDWTLTRPEDPYKDWSEYYSPLEQTP